MQRARREKDLEWGVEVISDAWEFEGSSRVIEINPQHSKTHAQENNLRNLSRQNMVALGAGAAWIQRLRAVGDGDGKAIHGAGCSRILHSWWIELSQFLILCPLCFLGSSSFSCASLFPSPSPRVVFVSHIHFKFILENHIVINRIQIKDVCNLTFFLKKKKTKMFKF